MLTSHSRRARQALVATAAVSLLALGACGEDDSDAVPAPATLDEAALSAAAEAARTGPDGPEDPDSSTAEASEAPVASETPGATGGGAFVPRLVDPGLLESADLVVPLTTDEVVLPPEAGVTGYGEAALAFRGDRLTIAVAVEVLDGDAPVGAGIYLGEPGIDGAPVLDLGTFAPGSPEGQAVWYLEDQSVPFIAESWRTGDLDMFYVEVVTELGGSGFARGQLVGD